MAFADFKSQQRIVQFLQRSLERGRLGHAYLFTGNQLAILESMALTLAQTLNCLRPLRSAVANLPVDCCGSCPTCEKIANANYPDLQWVRPESKSRIITIDQMRDLMQTVHLKPMQADYKVAVIVAADRMNVQAANAFLKTLEEPPDKSVLILLSIEPQRLMETILSRCLRLNFAGESGLLANPDLMAWLQRFSDTASGEQKTVLNRYRLLGNLLAKLAQLKAEIEKGWTARSPLERYEDIDPSLRDKWEEELAASVEAEYRRQRAEFVAAMQSWLRDVWLHTLGQTQDLNFPDMQVASQTIARRITSAAALENLRILEQIQRHLESNVQEALALEVGLLKLAL